MKKFAFTLVLIISFLSMQSQKLEDVLEKHFEHKGQKNLNEFKTMVIKGESVQQGQETSYTLMVKRPHMMRLEVEMQGQKFIQAYNGKKGWSVMPWTGSTEPVELSADQLHGIVLMSDIDGPLYNWNEKAYDVTLQGEDRVKGKEVYHISAQINPDMKVDYYIGKEDYMIHKEVYNLNLQNQQVKQQNYYSQYKPVQGVMISFKQETGTGNQIIRSSQIEEVSFGAEINNDQFDMPQSN